MGTLDALLSLPDGFNVAWDYCLENDVIMPGYVPFTQQGMYTLVIYR